MIRGVQSALAVRRQRSLRVQPPGARRGSAFNSTSSLAGSERRGSVLSTKVSNSSVTMFHIGIVFIVLGTILIITSLIPGHVRTDQWDDLFGTGCFLFLIGGLLGLINRMVAKGEDEKLNSYVQRKLARSKSGLPHPHYDDDADVEAGNKHGRHNRHHQQHHSRAPDAHHQHQRGSSGRAHQHGKNGGKPTLQNKRKRSSSTASATPAPAPAHSNGAKNQPPPEVPAVLDDESVTNGVPKGGGADAASSQSPSKSLEPIAEEQRHPGSGTAGVEIVVGDASGPATSAAAGGGDIVEVHQVRIEDRPPSPTAKTPLMAGDINRRDGAEQNEDGDSDESRPLRGGASKFKVPRQKSTS